jgi:hypothetical protein
MISVVPVIYDLAGKTVKRWFLLDSENQRDDPAFRPNHDEGMLDIPAPIFQTFRTDPTTGVHALDQIQSYVNGNAP